MVGMVTREDNEWVIVVVVVDMILVVGMVGK